MSSTTRRRRRRRRRRGFVALGAVVVLAVGGWLWAGRGPGDTPLRERCSAQLDGTAWYLSPEQAENAALIAGTTVQRGMPPRAATIALATALQESKLINISYGDRDSLGLFQQRPSQGWGTAEQVQDPVYATDAFLDRLAQVPGYTELDVAVAAQKVQRSGYPDAYAQHEVRARAWASGLTGQGGAMVSCELAPVAVGAARPVDEVGTFLRERLQRDLGVAPDEVTVGAVVDGTAEITVGLSAMPGATPTQAGWALAQWAVATASVTDVVQVQWAMRTWTRADGVAAGRDRTLEAWQPDDAADDGRHVHLRVAAEG